MRSFTPRRTASWEYQGLIETPFAHRGKERPLVAMFKHVAREADGAVVDGFQCCYPNEIGYTLDQLVEAQESPVGHFKKGMSREDLDRATHFFGAVATFKNATDAELDALMPKKKDADVIVFVSPAEERHLKYA